MTGMFDDLIPQQGQTPQAVKGGMFDDLIPQQGQQNQPSAMQDIGRSAASGVAKVGTMLMNPIGAVREAENYMAGNALTGIGAAYQGMGGDISPEVARWMRNPMGDMSQDPNSILLNKALPLAVQSETGMNMNYQPQTGMGRATQTAIESLPMVAGSGGGALTPVLRAIGIGAGSEGGQDIAQSMGAGERGQQVGKFLGGGAGAMLPEGINAAVDMGKNTPVNYSKNYLLNNTHSSTSPADIQYANNLPSSADIRGKASENYNAGQQQGSATFAPQVTNDFLDTSAQGILPNAQRVADLTADTPSAKLLTNLQKWRDTPMNVQEMLDLDKHLGNLADNEFDPVTRRMSPEGVNLLKIQEVLRDKTENANVDNAGQTKDAVNSIVQGRKLSAAAFKMNDIERIQQNASNALNPQTALKQGFRSLANNPARLRGYSIPEIAAINKAAKDGVITGALKVIASPLLDTIAGAAGGGVPGGIAGAYLSKIPKAMIESRQNARAQNVKNLIANRPEVRSAFQ